LTVRNFVIFVAPLVDPSFGMEKKSQADNPKLKLNLKVPGFKRTKLLDKPLMNVQSKSKTILSNINKEVSYSMILVHLERKKSQNSVANTNKFPLHPSVQFYSQKVQA
jgi:hypothetical protein